MRSITNRLRGRGGELRLALRTTLAGLITFALGRALKLPQAYWAVLTSVIVVQASVATSLKAGVDRMLGTIAGAVWGVCVTLAIPHHDPLTLGVTLAIALAPLALVAALRPSYRVAPVTAIIVLLSTTGVQLGPVHYALERVLEIALGCLIGLAVSLLIVPARAQGLLADAAADVLLALRALSDLLLAEMTRPPDPAALTTTYGRLNQALGRAEALVDEVKRERAHWLSDTPDAEPFVRTLRRLRHDFTAIDRALTEPLPPAALHELAGAVGYLRRAVADDLAASTTSVRERRPAPSLDVVDEALLAFRDSMDRLRQSGTLRQLAIGDVERVFSLAFALQQLGAHLADLAQRIAEWTAERATASAATGGAGAGQARLTEDKKTS